MIFPISKTSNGAKNIQYILLNDTTSVFDSKVICLKAAFFRYFMVALTYIFSISKTSISVPSPGKKAIFDHHQSVWIIFFHILWAFSGREQKKILNSIHPFSFYEALKLRKRIWREKNRKKGVFDFCNGQIENSIKSKPLDEFPYFFFYVLIMNLFIRITLKKKRIFRNIAKILASYVTKRN